MSDSASKTTGDAPPAPGSGGIEREPKPTPPARGPGAEETARDAGAEELPDEELLIDLADLFKLFSDTTRIKILYTILRGEMRVADIAEATSTSQSAVSHQLRILKQGHLVRFRRNGRSIEYSLADDHVNTMLEQGMSHVCE